MILVLQQEEIIKLTENLIYVINTGDYKNYTKICDLEMSAIEPESFGNVITGMPFHKFYFDNGNGFSTRKNVKEAKR